ncbi:hypothetical protein [Maritimibacter sp. DP1N21-5]|uniref:hypothetical protein n=1 Tax=Maritimibacter sp. DP1N21-5 TaxID=2836867 RepID=UPI001C4437C8|nr:hypothetical protein [Maritimibacter sp. DP1N21-5]MBV7408199.1 hypothetical protein [Maritimibacter sp. DP1N21-5]
MAKQTYDVKRPHQGDRWYAVGEKRVAQPGEVDHLVARGVLVLHGEDEAPAKPKAAPKPKNKAVVAEKNKSEADLPDDEGAADEGDAE